jgi:hypothetical protein
MKIQLRLGNCLDRLKEMEENSCSAMISDPPYDLVSGGETGFMGKEWDGTGIAFSQELWTEVYRVLKPKGIVKAFGGTRTFHRMALAMEKAGFVGIAIEAWAYGSGFPKSHNVSKSLDKHFGAEREVIGTKRGVGGENMNDIVHGRDVRTHEDEGGKGVGAYGTGAKQVAIDVPITAPATEEAKKWEGWGTALKPAWEPICVGYKP